MSDTFSFTLESPLTAEQINLITDAEFEYTDSITFITPKGKEVEFGKVKKGKWIDVNGDGSLWRCDQCKDTACCKGDYCPNCGAEMGETE